MGEVGVFDVQVVEHLTLAIRGEAVRVGSYFGYFTCSFRLA
jgi:hypothetical protein